MTLIAKCIYTSIRRTPNDESSGCHLSSQPRRRSLSRAANGGRQAPFITFQLFSYACIVSQSIGGQAIPLSTGSPSQLIYWPVDKTPSSQGCLVYKQSLRPVNSFSQRSFPRVMAKASWYPLRRAPALITFVVLTGLFVPSFFVSLDVQHFAVLCAPTQAAEASSALPPPESLTSEGHNNRLSSNTLLKSVENVSANSSSLDIVSYSVSIDAEHLPHPNGSHQEWSYDNILFFSVSFDFSCIIRVLIFIYCCLVIGYLCDEYFVPALENIGEALNFSTDLIGAILIPFGTSGPEIFSSAVGVFFAQNDIGTGAIIGSSVFNVLAIPAACGLAAVFFIGHSIELDEVPILRDMAFYIVSIVVLILVVKDNTVDLLDSFLLILLFVIYITVMLYNSKHTKSQAPVRTDSVSEIKSQNNHTNYPSHVGPIITIKNGPSSEKLKLLTNSLTANNVNGKNGKNNNGNKYKMKEYLNKCNEIMATGDKKAVPNVVAKLHQVKSEKTTLLLGDCPNKQAAGIEAKLYAFIEDIIKKEHDDVDLSGKCKSQYEKLSGEEEDNGFGFTNNFFLRWLLMPFTILFYITLPTRYSSITFFISIAWLSALSYVTVWSISGLSEYLGIPPTVSGMTILAAGSAVPDLVTSIIVIKKTRDASMGGSMAICAAISSNIFAILLGLGLPWTIRILMNWFEAGRSYAASSIILESDALPYTSIILLATVFILYCTFRMCKWKINAKFALICMVLHVLFITSNIALELFIANAGAS